jgi:hypothetical protein
MRLLDEDGDRSASTTTSACTIASASATPPSRTGTSIATSRIARCRCTSRCSSSTGSRRQKTRVLRHSVACVPSRRHLPPAQIRSAHPRQAQPCRVASMTIACCASTVDADRRQRHDRDALDCAQRARDGAQHASRRELPARPSHCSCCAASPLPARQCSTRAQATAVGCSAMQRRSAARTSASTRTARRMMRISA